MWQRTIAGLLASVVLLAAAARADIIYVDDDNCPGPGSGTEADPYCSIQTAIDNAVDLNEIVVAPGTYLETIDFLGKAITLRSSDGPQVTIIDARQTGTVVRCTNDESPDTVLEGFTITGGRNYIGGGMRVSSSPTVSNCTFTGNAAVLFQDSLGFGGGITNTGSPTLIGCTFVGNTAEHSGGAMWNAAYSAAVIGCVFEANTAAEIGGGMYNDNAHVAVIGCTFSGNSAVAGGAMYNREGWATATNCILWGDVGGEIVDAAGSDAIVIYSDVQGGWPGPGNIDADPMFVDPDNGDYRLSPGSPCIDAGDNSAVPKGIRRDLDGNPRIVVGSSLIYLGAAPIVDMGAYEYQFDPLDRMLPGVFGTSDAADVATYLGLRP